MQKVRNYRGMTILRGDDGRYHVEARNEHSPGSSIIADKFGSVGLALNWIDQTVGQAASPPA